MVPPQGIPPRSGFVQPSHQQELISKVPRKLPCSIVSPSNALTLLTRELLSKHSIQYF